MQQLVLQKQLQPHENSNYIITQPISRKKLFEILEGSALGVLETVSLKSST
jgi:hypothetical protein